jgi:hypothetical protein
MQNESSNSNPCNPNELRENLLKTNGFYGESKYIKEKIEELAGKMKVIKEFNYDQIKKNN